MKINFSPDCKLKNGSNVPFYAQFEHSIEEHIYLRKIEHYQEVVVGPMESV
jgi:hypothetical protein